MSPKAELPDFPESSTQLEDYVAALFQASRYFVEKGIIERDPTDILELDAVATSYDESPPSSVLVEAKSGDWGFGEAFKVLGWMRYLGFKRGALFVSKEIEDKDPSFVNKKVSPHGVSVVHLGGVEQAFTRFAEAGFGSIDDKPFFEMMRFSYWVERTLINRLRAKVKADKTKQGPAAAWDYHGLVNDTIFFIADPRDRLRALYEAYQSHPRVALGMAREMEGHPFDPAASGTTCPTLKSAMISGTCDELQACFYIEHRARLAILKAAIDAVEAGMFAQAKPGALNIVLKELMLPVSFRNGLEEIRTEPAFRRYALFWQVFLWGFGGFYLADRQDDEFKLLSDRTGVPLEEIPNALKVFERLFPPADWFASLKGTQCTIFKMMPAPLRGIGSAYRILQKGFKGIAEFGYTDYTGNRMGEWTNAAIKLLT